MMLLFALAAWATPTHYRLDITSASEAKVPVLGWQRSETVSVSLVTLEADGAWSHKVCTAEIRDRSALVRTELAQAFIDNIPPTRTRAEFAGDDLRVDLGREVVGWDPSITGVLPTTAEDPGVIDHEQDGRPGATVWIHISGMGTYGMDIVQVAQVVLIGRRTDSGWAGKLHTVSIEQQVLGADKKMLAKTPELRPNDDESTFALTPTEATDCKALLSAG